MKILKRALLLSFVSILAITQSQSGKEGTTHIWGKNQVDNTFGVKIDIDSNLISSGDIIDFHIRGDKSGKLEVFRIGVSKNEAWMMVQGWDSVNKVNREFTFQYNKNLKYVEDMFLYYIRENDVGSVQYMIKKFPSLLKLSFDGHYPLHEALFLKCYDVAKLLINSGFDVNVKQKNNGDSPLDVAVYNNLVDIAELLLKKGASINSLNDKGEISYNYCMSNDIKIIKLLIENGAPFNEKDKRGKTAIQYAVSFCFIDEGLEKIKYLIDKGADLKVTDDEGNNLLHTASKCASEKVVKLLIDRGVDINIKNNDGKTPLKIAKERGHQDIIDLLKKHEAKE